MTLNFTNDELLVLQQLVAQELRQLGVEIHRTDSLAYRDELEEREKTLKAVSERLNQLPVGASAAFG